MKIRTAKKIIGWNQYHRINKHQMNRFMQLRPPYKDKQGRTIYPSWHDIDIIRRARTRLHQWIDRFEKKQPKPKWEEVE